MVAALCATAWAPMARSAYPPRLVRMPLPIMTELTVCQGGACGQNGGGLLLDAACVLASGTEGLVRLLRCPACMYTALSHPDVTILPRSRSNWRTAAASAQTTA